MNFLRDAAYGAKRLLLGLYGPATQDVKHDPVEQLKREHEDEVQADEVQADEGQADEAQADEAQELMGQGGTTEERADEVQKRLAEERSEQAGPG